MSLLLSTAFRAALLGPNAFETILTNIKAVVFAGAQPENADFGTDAAVPIARITRNGAAYDAAVNGLNLSRVGVAVFNSTPWMLQGTASGVASFVRFMRGTDDGLAYSTTLPRIDFPVFLRPPPGEPLPGNGLALPSVTITSLTATPVDAFYYSIPPL